MNAWLAPALVAGSLFSPLALAQDAPAPPEPAVVVTTPVEAAPGLVDDAGEIEEIEQTLSELRRAEQEAQAVRAELRELRQELGELKRARSRTQRWDGDHGDRVAFGSPVRVEAGQEVEEVVAFGDDVEVYGTVLGDATAFGGSVLVGPTGVIHGDVVTFGGDINVERGGVVQGGRVALGVPGVAIAAMPDDAPESQAIGSVGALASDAQGLLSSIYRRLVLLLSFAGAGVLVVGLFPNRVTRIASTLEERPFRSAFVGAMATGFLALFSLVFAVITLGLGLPVSMMVVALLGLAWLMGFVGLCQAVGDRLPFEQKPHGRWLAFLVGTVLITCVGSLPLVGWLVVLAASTIGIGAALSSRFGGN